MVYISYRLSNRIRAPSAEGPLRVIAGAQDGTTAEMLYDVRTQIETLTTAFTLEPGDVIATGTPAGVGPLRDGDVVEVEIPGVGTIRNPVRSAE